MAVSVLPLVALWFFCNIGVLLLNKALLSRRAGSPPRPNVRR